LGAKLLSKIFILSTKILICQELGVVHIYPSSENDPFPKQRLLQDEIHLYRVKQQELRELWVEVQNSLGIAISVFEKGAALLKRRDPIF